MSPQKFRQNATITHHPMSICNCVYVCCVLTFDIPKANLTGILKKRPPGYLSPVTQHAATCNCAYVCCVLKRNWRLLMVRVPRSGYFSFPSTQSTQYPCTCPKQPRLAILGVAGDTRQAEATEYARPDASSSMLQTLGCLGFQTLKHALKSLTPCNIKVPSMFQTLSVIFYPTLQHALNSLIACSYKLASIFQTF